MLIDNSNAIIAAHDQAYGIGKHNQLPWRIKGDLKFFRTITSQVPEDKSPEQHLQNAVIMGRNTWQSLPDLYKPLSERINVVLTKKNSHVLPGSVLHYVSLEDAVQSLLQKPCARIFVIGGATVYQKAMHMSIFETLYITEIEGNYDCDVFFPNYHDYFDLIESSDTITENNYNYRFKVYRRRPKHQSALAN